MSTTLAERPRVLGRAGPPRPIFVYGTLRTGEHNHGLMGDCLKAVKAAMAPDQALHATGLPYAVDAPGRGAVVGEVVIAHPRSYGVLLRRLDRLEGFMAPGWWQNHYERVIRPVLVGGRAVEAWMYQAGPAVRSRLCEANRVPSGDWLDRDGRR